MGNYNDLFFQVNNLKLLILIIYSSKKAFESYGSTQFNSIADKIVTNLNSEETCLNGKIVLNKFNFINFL